MRKHAVLAFLAAVTMALCLVGCGGSSASSGQSGGSATSGAASQAQSQQPASSAAVPQNPDEEFLPELAAGLEARWKLSDQTKDQEDTPQLRGQLVNAELDHIAVFKGTSFEDAELGQLAERYIAAVEEQAACLASYDTDYVDYAKRWDATVRERFFVIKDLVERHGFKVSGDYQATLDETVEEAKVFEEEEKVPADIRQAVEEDIPAAAAAFQKADGKTYRVTVVNPSRATFDYYNLEALLLNENGGLVESHMMTVNDWAPGAEATFEFEAGADFAKLDTLYGRWYGTWTE